MDDIEARKREILKRLNAKIKEAREFENCDSSSKGSLSSRRNLSENKGIPELKGPKPGEQYIKEMRIRVSQDSKIPKSLKQSQFHAVMDDNASISSSQTSIASDHRIKFQGRVRDFLAQKSSDDSIKVYKKPWIGGSDRNKSSKTDEARSSLSSITKPRKIVAESTAGPSRLRSILKPQTRPVSTRSNMSATSRISKTSKASETSQESESSKATKTSRTSKTSRVSGISSRPESSKQSESISKISKTSRPSTTIKSNQEPPLPISVTKKPIKSLLKRPLSTLPKKPATESFETTQKQDSGDTSRCQYCSRPFNTDRLPKHESICQKTSQKTESRGAFDSSRKRLEGTEIRAKSAPSKSSGHRKSGKSEKMGKSEESDPPKTSNWRKNHEEFINSLRQSKAISSHIAKGGKVTDLPVIVSKNNGTPCPHCSRKFGESSFERHVQICSKLKHFGPRK